MICLEGLEIEPAMVWAAAWGRDAAAAVRGRDAVVEDMDPAVTVYAQNAELKYHTAKEFPVLN